MDMDYEKELIKQSFKISQATLAIADIKQTINDEISVLEQRILYLRKLHAYA